MDRNRTTEVYDYVVIGSGFGGSVSALRLAEKGFSVLVLERGKRYRDEDFAKSNWNVRKYLWSPFLRCFGILEISPFKDVFVLHGSGVGGGSLGYANVLVEPSDALFRSPEWSHLMDWRKALAPHYETAKQMLGVATNPRNTPADDVLKKIACELGTAHTFKSAPVGTFFGEEGKTVPDPYFGGKGPRRTGCNFCGACMVGCRIGAKNTLVKNYLYFAEKLGVAIRPETEVRDVRPIGKADDGGARYEVLCRSSTGLFKKSRTTIRARNVVFSAGTLGTLRLLFRTRDITGSLRNISQQLGKVVRTNSEALLGSTTRTVTNDYSQGVAITSLVQADDVTTVEPVRYPAGSSLMRFLAGPLVEEAGSVVARLAATLSKIVMRPMDFFRTHLVPKWAERSTILLVMQTTDNCIKLALGRSAFTGWRKDLVSVVDSERPTSGKIAVGHTVARKFAEHTDGIASGSLNEGLFDIPMTAHILGGVSFGTNAEHGVVGTDCQVHNYPGLYVVDGSIVPANPGVNPSLTITALAEYAMSRIKTNHSLDAREPAGLAKI